MCVFKMDRYKINVAVILKLLSQLKVSQASEREMIKKTLIDAYIYSGQQPIRDDVFKCLDSRPSLLKAVEIGERILSKMTAFVEVFVSGMVG